MAGHSPSSTGKGPALIPLGHHTGKPAIPLHRPVTLIGSRSNARIHLTSSTVSKAHALVVKDGPVTYIRDLASRSHVYVNGEQIREQNLEDGDLIKIGSFTFKFASGRALGDPNDVANPADAKLEVSGADFPVPIDQRVLLIGRRPTCDVHLLEESCSTAHAVIFQMNGNHHVRDLGSRTGTYVNGVAIHQHQLNPGDNVRIGETKLHYTPGALDSGGVDDLILDELEVVDDTARRPLSPVEHVEFDPAPASHAETSAAYDADAMAAASAETVDDAMALSGGPQNLSRDEESADSASRSGLSTDEVAGSTDLVSRDVGAFPLEGEEDFDLSPRRGWRPVQHEEAEAPHTSPTAEAEAPAAVSGPEQQDNSVLRISPQSDSDSAVLDRDDSVAQPPREEITAGSFQNLSDTSGDDPTAIPLDDIVDDRSAAKHKRIDIDLSAASSAPPPLKIERPQALAPLDFSSLRGEDAADTSSAADELDLLERDEPAMPSLRFDADTPDKSTKRDEPPLIDVDQPIEEPIAEAPPPTPIKEPIAEVPAPTPAEAPVEHIPAKGKRGRKPAAKKDAAPKAPAKRGGRRKKGEEIVAPETAPDEIIAASEPTPDSSLEIEAATKDVPIDESAIEDALAAPAEVESLSDSGLARAVADLSGEGGEIIESSAADIAGIEAVELEKLTIEEPIAEIPLDEPVVEALPHAMVEQIEAPVAAAPAIEEPPADEPSPVVDEVVARPARDEAPASKDQRDYRWGANQENFLGGVPVALPPAPHGEVKPHAEPAAPADESQTEHAEEHAVAKSETSQQIDDVNALIDEILAPADSTGDEATPDDLLAHTAAKGDEAQPPVDELVLDEVLEEKSHDLLEPEKAPALELPPLDPAAEELIVARMPDVMAPAQSRPVVPIPPPNRNRGPRRKRGEAADQPGRSLRDDERIPPYVGAGPATAGRVTTGFDGLAMPPVREADVFSQMSPPVVGGSLDPFGSPIESPSPSALTPMDLVEADEPPRGSRRPIRPQRDMFFGAAAASAAAPAISDAPEHDGVAPTSRRRPPVRQAIPGAPLGAAITPTPLHDEHQHAPRRPAVATGEEGPDLAEVHRRRKLRLVSILLVAMLVCSAATFAALRAFWPVSSVAEAEVQFDNYETLTMAERKAFQDEQQKLLSASRTAARRELSQLDPQIHPGFLDDPEKYLAAVSLTGWSESRKGAMVLRYRGNDDPGAKTRMHAMAKALVNANDSRMSQAQSARRQYNELIATKSRYEQEKRTLENEIQALRIQGESAPDGATITKLRHDVEAAEKAWGDAIAAAKACEVELQRLRQSSAGAAAVAAPDTGAAAVAGSSQDEQDEQDEQVVKLEEQLQALTAKMTAAQAAKNEQAAQARKALDATLAEFQKQIAATRDVMSDSPELAAYVAAAQRLQETTRSLIDDLIRRQEQQYSRLNELKTTLTEKMEQKKSEQAQGDPELRSLTERLEAAKRQLNAAKGAGMRKETEDKQAEVDLLMGMIRARQELLPQDAIKDYVETIAQLQQIIDVTQKNVEDDRKRTETLLEQLQKSFTSSTVVEKLPEAQKSVASELEKRLADINSARQQYNAAISATAVDEDEEVKAARTEIAALNAQVEARRKEIADADQKNASEAQEKTRADQIAAKEKEFSDLTRAEADARLTYTNREKDLRDAQAAAQLARDSQDRLQELQSKNSDMDAKIAQLKNDEDMRRKAAQTAVVPLPVNEATVRVNVEDDKRQVVAISGAGGVLLLFACAILFNLHGSTREVSLGAMSNHDPAPAETEPPTPINGAAANTNGNGRTPHDDAEDHEPAVI